MCGEPVGSAIQYLTCECIHVGSASMSSMTWGQSFLNVYTMGLELGSAVSLAETQAAAPAGVASVGSTSSASALGSPPLTSIQMMVPRPASEAADCAYGPSA